MATVLITGGTGLIGNALTKELINKGFEVIILSRHAAKKNQGGRMLFPEAGREDGSVRARVWRPLLSWGGSPGVVPGRRTASPFMRCSNPLPSAGFAMDRGFPASEFL